MLVRLVVPTAELLALHAEVQSACLPHLPTGPMSHREPGQWTAHVTLARRECPPSWIGRALRIAGSPIGDHGQPSWGCGAGTATPSASTRSNWRLRTGASEVSVVLPDVLALLVTACWLA